jgi:hypothetical protein
MKKLIWAFVLLLGFGSFMTIREYRQQASEQVAAERAEQAVESVKTALPPPLEAADHAELTEQELKRLEGVREMEKRVDAHLNGPIRPERLAVFDRMLEEYHRFDPADVCSTPSQRCDYTRLYQYFAWAELWYDYLALNRNEHDARSPQMVNVPPTMQRPQTALTSREQLELSIKYREQLDRRGLRLKPD